MFFYKPTIQFYLRSNQPFSFQLLIFLSCTNTSTLYPLPSSFNLFHTLFRSQGVILSPEDKTDEEPKEFGNPRNGYLRPRHNRIYDDGHFALLS